MATRPAEGRDGCLLETFLFAFFFGLDRADGLLDFSPVDRFDPTFVDGDREDRPTLPVEDVVRPFDAFEFPAMSFK